MSLAGFQFKRWGISPNCMSSSLPPFEILQKCRNCMRNNDLSLARKQVKILQLLVCVSVCVRVCVYVCVCISTDFLFSPIHPLPPYLITRSWQIKPSKRVGMPLLSVSTTPPWREEEKTPLSRPLQHRLHRLKTSRRRRFRWMMTKSGT